MSKFELTTAVRMSAPKADMTPLEAAYSEQEIIKPRHAFEVAALTSGYSVVGGGVTGMQRVLDWVRAHIKRVMQDTGAEVIVVHGTSGTAVAFGLLGSGWDEYPLVMLRKAGEGSHGHHIEALNPPTGEHDVYFEKYVFLDDFTATGATVRHVRGAMAGEMVGTMMYARNKGDGMETLSASRCAGNCPMFTRN